MQLAEIPSSGEKKREINFDTPEFLQQLCKLDNAAWDLLVKTYNKDLLRAALRITSDQELAKEILQEAHIAAMKKIEAFERKSSIKTWLYSIVKKTALYLRRSKRVHDERFQLAKDDLDEIPSNVTFGWHQKNQETETQEMRDRTLHAVISTLDLKKRAVFIAQIEEPELEAEGIAKKLGLNSADTARTRKHYGVLELKQRYQQTFNRGGLPAVLSKINNAAVKRALKMEEKTKHPYLFKSYYTTEHVKHDLEFAVLDLQKKGYKNVKTIRDLSTDNIKAATIFYSGIEEKANNGMTYIARAGYALGLAKSIKEAEKTKPAAILLALKKIAGVEFRDKNYYTAENVRHDLESAILNFRGDKKQKIKKPLNIFELSTDNMKYTTIKCANGETVSGRTYLCQAGMALGIIKNTSEASSNFKLIISALKLTASKVVSYQAWQWFEKKKVIAS